MMCMCLCWKIRKMLRLESHINIRFRLIASRIGLMKHFTSTNYIGSQRCFKGYTAVLRSLRLRTMRQRLWYRVLSGLERAQVDLTLKVVRRVQSPSLARVLDLIVDKLSNALQSMVSRITRAVGFPMALKLSKMAQGWGNKSAQAWAQDSGFARFLAIMSLNSNNGCSPP